MFSASASVRFLQVLLLVWACGVLTTCGSAENAADAERAAERSLESLASAELSRHAPPDEAAHARAFTLSRAVVYQSGDGRSARRVRVVLWLEGEPPFRRTERVAPAAGERRIVLAFEDTNAGDELVRDLRVGEAGLLSVHSTVVEGGLEVSFSVTADARYQMFALPNPYRLVLDIERPRQANDTAKGKLLVLDPGHGGDDLGSPGPHGLWEGKVTLDLAKRVRAWLSQIAPEIRVRMTRESDVYITLEERAAMANSLGADLFVSVHLNAATTVVDKGGVAAFVLDTSNDRNVLRLAARENGTSTADVSPLQFLVGSLARSEQRDGSLKAASLIQRGTLVSGRRMLPTLADRGVKSAMFYVLVGCQMPAVLVEASFITQPDEALALTRDSYRDALAEGVARGIARAME